MQLWPDLSDYYKVNVLFPFVDHWLQEVDSRFSQRCNEHWALTVSIDNIPWSKWNSQLLTKNPYCEGILPFLSRGSKVEKFFEIIPLEERAATANSDWTAGCLQPSDISSYSQGSLPFLLLPPGSVPCGRSFSDWSETSQALKPVYNDQRTLEWPRDAPYSNCYGLHTGAGGHLPNKTKL